MIIHIKFYIRSCRRVGRGHSAANSSLPLSTLTQVSPNERDLAYILVEVGQEGPEDHYEPEHLQHGAEEAPVHDDESEARLFAGSLWIDLVGEEAASV